MIEEGEVLKKEEGLVQEMPVRFKEIPPGFPDRQKDRLVGVLLETDKNRLFFLDLMAESLKKGGHLLVCHGDVDSLKGLNDISRQVGDRAIIHSACAVGREVDRIFSRRGEIQAFVFRSDHAADETWFYVLGLSEDQLDKAQKLAKNLEEQKPVNLPNVVKPISFSSGVVFSASPEFEDFTTQTRKALEKGEIQRPYNLLKELKNAAWAMSEGKKIEKIKARIAKAGEVSGTDEFIEAISSELSGDRLPEKTLRAIFREVRARAIKEVEEGRKNW